MISINAAVEVVWPYLLEFERRRLWETDLEALDYDGPVACGVTGTMKLAEMPAMRFELVAFTPGRVIADRVDIPGGGALTFTHAITVDGGVTCLEQRVRLDKPAPDSKDLDFLCAVFADTPQAAWRLKDLAER